jgi:hypothetical protein
MSDNQFNRITLVPSERNTAASFPSKMFPEVKPNPDHSLSNLLDNQNRANAQLRKFVLEGRTESKIQKAKILKLEVQIEELQNKAEVQNFQNPIELLSVEAQQNFKLLKANLARGKGMPTEHKNPIDGGLYNLNYMTTVLNGLKNINDVKKRNLILNICNTLLVERFVGLSNDHLGIIPHEICNQIFNTFIKENEQNPKIKSLFENCFGPKNIGIHVPDYLMIKFISFITGNFDSNDRLMLCSNGALEKLFNELFIWLEN